MSTALLIPIYCPSEKVLPFLKKFKKGDFSSLLVVNDGSPEQYASVYEEIKKEGVFEVFSYPNNQGKGHAIKAGIEELLKKDKDLTGIVTADGDGQHAYEDILRVRDSLKSHPTSLIMGERDFSGPDVPKRSKGGNAFSAFYFKLTTMKKLGDTQTGLRGIPQNLFSLALETPGDRYEYEMNFLLDAARATSIEQVNIQTIYEDKNSCSHFRPFRDTCRIYATPIKYGAIALSSALLDLILFYVFHAFVFASF